MRRKYVAILVALFVLLLNCKELSDKTPEGTIQLLFKYSKKSEWQAVENLFSSGHLNSEDIQKLQELFATDEVTNIETELLKKDTQNATVLIILKSDDVKKINIDPVELILQDSSWKIVYTDSLPLSLNTDNYLLSDEAGIYYILGYNYGKLGFYNEAIEFYKQSINLRSDVALAYWGLGAAYVELGYYDEAIRALKQAVEIEPDNPKIHYNLGHVYSKLGRYDEAIESYKESICIKPDNTYAYGGLGTVYFRLKRYDEAIEAFNQAVITDPDYSIAYSSRAYNYLELEKLDIATKDFNKAIELDKDNKDAFVGLAIIYYKIGDKEKAIENYSKAIELDNRYLGKIGELADEEIFYTESQLEVITEILKEMGH